MKNIDLHVFYLLVTAILFGIMVGNAKDASDTVTHNNNRILDIARDSHFIGCARITANFKYCRELSEDYRKQLKLDLGF